MEKLKVLFLAPPSELRHPPHGHRIVCDDPHKVGEVESDTVRKTAIDWWDVAMSTRVNDPKTSAMVIVMQRCHQRDLSGHLL